MRRGEHHITNGFDSWRSLDEKVWSLVWEWESTHQGLSAARCCATTIINRSDGQIQLARVQMVTGRNVLLLGSEKTGFDAESRSILPDGVVVIFMWAFSPSPIEIGNLKANINTAAFWATVSSVQRQSCCESRGGFTAGYLEKTVTEWWSKYVLLIT